MAPRNDVEMITLNKGVIVQCTICRIVHKVFPLTTVIKDQAQFLREVDALADAHKPNCTAAPVIRCGTKCPTCGNICLREQGHKPGHWCQDAHQW